MSYEPTPGMHVVCVNGPLPNELRDFPQVIFPAKGTVYRIREVVHAFDLGLRFLEIVNAPMDWRGRPFEPIFHYLAFKLLDERRLDVFRQHLVPVPRERELVCQRS